MEDLGALWTRFFQEQIPTKIPNTTSNVIYAVYTDYESDHTGQYTTIIGQEVSDLSYIPEGLVGRKFPAQTSQHFVAKGTMPNAVADVWNEIWAKDQELNRSYQYDYEVYGPKSQDPQSPEVDLYIGIKS